MRQAALNANATITNFCLHFEVFGPTHAFLDKLLAVISLVLARVCHLLVISRKPHYTGLCLDHWQVNAVLSALTQATD